MSHKARYIYLVTESPEEDAPVIFKGLRAEVLQKYHITPGAMDYYYVNRKPLKRNGKIYYLAQVPLIDDNSDEARLQKKQEKFNKEIESIEWHLAVYGNTAIYKKPEKYLERLEKDGFIVKAKHYPKRVIKYKKNVPGENGELFSFARRETEVYKEYWYLELIERREAIV